MTEQFRPIEPEQQPQPVQVREGQWRLRNGDIRNVIPTPADHSQAGRCSWRDAHYYETWYPNGRYSISGDHPLDLCEYLGPIKPEPEPEPQADYTPPEGWRALAEGEVLQEEDYFFKKCPTPQVGTKVGEHQTYIRRVEQPEPEQQPRTITPTQRELNELRCYVGELETAINKLQTTQESTFKQGTARAVEITSEWLEPFRCCSPTLCAAILQEFPTIMRNLMRLSDED